MAIALLLWLGCGDRNASAAAPAPSAPNVLWIVADDIGHDLGCYGEAAAQTPRLDALAREGRRYTRAYATAPVCSPSRSAFVTGMYQTAIDAHHHRSHRLDGRRLPDSVETIMARVRRAGYFTANIRQFPPGVPVRAIGKTDYNFQVEQPFDSDRWTDLARHQPFFAQVHFREPHRPYAADPVHPTDPARVTLPPYLPDHPVVRADWAQYLDTIAELDRKTGQVLDLLEREGLAGNTLVVFFGDNGRDDFRGKFYAYEQGSLVPLLIRWPGRVPAGSVAAELVSLIDVTATTLFAAGLPVPPEMHGRPLLGSDARPREYVFTARDRIDETLDRVRTVRDARFKYIRNFEPERPYYQPFRYIEFPQYNPLNRLMQELHAAGRLAPVPARMLAPRRTPEELYDLAADPFELRNLVSDPAHAEQVRRLRGVLEQWMRETGDHGVIPESPAAREAELRSYREAVRNLEEKWKP